MRRLLSTIVFLMLGAIAALPSGSLAAPGEPVQIGLIEGLSGSFANAGEAVSRNLAWAIERINQRGGVKLPDGMHPLALVRFDSKGNTEEALALMRAALDKRIAFLAQGNSSATASALIDALDKSNEREPGRRALLLNYAAVEPALTNDKCSFWHFRFDANADMRLAALTDVMRDDVSIKKVYLIGQDYSFGQQVLKQGRAMLSAKRPDIEFVGEELHPIGKVKDFLPYAAKIKASGAQAVLTGNWGNDLTLLIKASREAGVDASFYTFYANALGAPAAIGEAGVGRVIAVAEWHPNVGGAASDRFYDSFHQRFPNPQDDYLHMRMQVMVEMLAEAIEKSGSAEAEPVARALEGLRYDGRTLGGVHHGLMRAQDHQFIQPLVVSVMAKAGTPGVRFDNEGSGYGFRTRRSVAANDTALPTTCKMQRP